MESIKKIIVDELAEKHPARAHGYKYNVRILTSVDGGKKFYYCPVFPSSVVSTLGAGDAFASTFCGALERTRLDVGKSLMYASVNSASVVSEFGATEGHITFEEIEKRLADNPDYTYLEG